MSNKSENSTSKWADTETTFYPHSQSGF